jgi:prepilin signal peptidase PulO-like enzyme (type II secretory pathway)
MAPLSLLGIPIILIPYLAFLYGVIIGSFLNVYIFRFHTGKSLSGKSHCLSCAHPLRPYDLIPVVSFFMLRGRCRDCGCRITPRYFLVELVTGLLFVAVTTVTMDVITLLLLWWFVSLLVIIAVYDFNHFVIPDFLTAILTGVAVLVLAYELLAGGSVMTTLYTILAASGAAGFYYLLWAISKGQWLGFGDVKLAFPLGLIVAPTEVFSVVVLSFWVGAAVSLILLGIGKLGRGKLALRFFRLNLTIKSVVPFAPFMIAGCLIVLFTNFNVLTLFSN